MASLYRVVAPRFVAGFIVDEGRVVKTAPILRRWVADKRLADALHVCWEQGWKVAHLG